MDYVYFATCDFDGDWLPFKSKEDLSDWVEEQISEGYNTSDLSILKVDENVTIKVGISFKETQVLLDDAA